VETTMNLETQTHLKALRDLLSYRLADLRAELSADAAAFAADGAGVALRDAAEQVPFERDLAEIESVEAALHRLDEGTYGDCHRCGRPIALQRLLVQPAALRCGHCQTLFERRQSTAVLPGA
jgi:DnaK suppressor protein